ncbi:hypothetical protein [Actibacterium ureilyticum]|uniref:hypothetical protein n=1 Tax=Actibacterium ureilyticum TaxID=1590614 RepID=UPI000BAAF00B|nr:hypothetical protein [Actibacterium ureilyticum]
MNMAQTGIAACCLALLSGCVAPTPGEQAPPDTPAAAPLPQAPPPPASAVTVEQFDTTTAAEREAAAAPVAAAEARLGTVVATLGNPTDPGFWVKTGLVSAPRPGRLEDPATGATVRVELRPLDAASDTDGQTSLAALRTLGVSLTGLPELRVYGL